MLIDDIAQHLHNNGIGVLGTSLFKSYLPESPNTCIAIFDTGGLEPDLDITDIKNPTFQILVRDISYSLGKTKLDSIRTLLHGKSNTDLGVGGTNFFYIFAVAEGGHIGRDDNNRDEFSINFRCKTR